MYKMNAAVALTKTNYGGLLWRCHSTSEAPSIRHFTIVFVEVECPVAHTGDEKHGLNTSLIKASRIGGCELGHCCL